MSKICSQCGKPALSEDMAFCPYCGGRIIDDNPANQPSMGLNMGDANAISGGVHMSDQRVINTTITTTVERAKTESELLQEQKLQFMQLVNEALSDGILEKDEVLMLERERIRIGLDEYTAKRLIENAKKNVSAGVRQTSLSQTALNLMTQVSAFIKANDMDKINQQLVSRLAACAKNTDSDEVQFKYHLCLFVTDPAALMKIQETDFSDNYWRTFWAHVAYIKKDDLGKADEMLYILERFSQYSEENLSLLRALDAWFQIGVAESRKLLNTSTGMYSTELATFADSLCFLVDGDRAVRQGIKEDSIVFYLVNVFDQESPEERAARIAAEEAARIRAQREAERRARQAQAEAERKARMEREEAERRAQLAQAEKERRAREAEAAARAAAERARAEAERKAAEAARARAEAARIQAEKDAQKRAQMAREAALANMDIRIDDIEILNFEKSVIVRPHFYAVNCMGEKLKWRARFFEKRNDKLLAMFENTFVVKDHSYPHVAEGRLNSMSASRNPMPEGTIECFLNLEVATEDEGLLTAVNLDISIDIKSAFLGLGTTSFFAHNLGPMAVVCGRTPQNYSDLMVDLYVSTHTSPEGKLVKLSKSAKPMAIQTLSDLAPRSGEAAYLVGIVAYDSERFAEACDFMTRAEYAGVEKAHHYLGTIYEKGLSVDKDLRKAADEYELSVKADFPVSMWPLINLYTGENEVMDLPRAYELLTILAAQGDADASLRAGRMLYEGEGVNQDKESGKELVRSARAAGADGADAVLTSVLTRDLFSMIDVHGHFSSPMDEEVFIKDVQEGLELNIPVALYYKALMAWEGTFGNPKNEALAGTFARKAYSSGLRYAGWILGQVNAKSDKRDIRNTAFSCISAAAEVGVEEARVYVAANCRKNDGTHEDIYKWVRIYENVEPLEPNKSAVYFLLGEAYRYGAGCDASQDTAVMYYQKAESVGNVEARLKMAYALFFGSGLEQNVAGAYTLFERLSAVGNSTAQKFLKKHKLPEQINPSDKHYEKRSSKLNELVSKYNELAHQLKYPEYSLESKGSFPYYLDDEPELKKISTSKLHGKLEDIYFDIVSETYALGK